MEENLDKFDYMIINVEYLLNGSLKNFKIFALDRFDLLDDELTGYDNICYFAITNDGSGLFLGHKSYSKYQRQLRITYWDNKIYSRETCIFVPQRINSLFVKNDKNRGENPIGVYPRQSGNYRAYCNDGYGKQIPLGTYKTEEEAFQAYKEYKEKLIKEVIDSYEWRIPEPYYSKLKAVMYNYKIEIND